jgi:hypothetical protein
MRNVYRVQSALLKNSSFCFENVNRGDSLDESDVHTDGGIILKWLVRDIKREGVDWIDEDRDRDRGWLL